MTKKDMIERLRAAQLMIRTVADQCHVSGKPGMCEWANEIADDTGDLALSLEVSEWMPGAFHGLDFSDNDITAVTNASWATIN